MHVAAAVSYGYTSEHPQVVRAINFLRRTQEVLGAWPGRWGVNYIYGTWQVLTGLRSIGFDMQDRRWCARRWNG